jgi:membrane-bound metal-dependent hydrolase YbcI (DUF457 family)
MALCLAHATAGYLGYEAVRPAGAHRPALLAAAVVLANGPDVDFLPGLLVGEPAAFHRGVTHTLAAVVVVAAVAVLAARLVPRWRGRWRFAVLWTGALWASHLVIDYFTTCAVPPHGGRFLWPLSSAYWIAPVTPLPEIIIDTTGRVAFLASVFNRTTAPVWAGELVMLVAAVVAVHAYRAWQTSDALAGAREEP